MALNNSEKTYGLVSQSLHWATALLILFLLPLGVYMHELPITTEAEVASTIWLYSLHKTIGLILFAIAVVRVIWMAFQPHPAPLHGGLEAFAAKTVHWLLYGSIIAMPLLGWMHHAATEGYAPIWWSFSQNLPFVPESEAVSHFFNAAHRICGIILVGSLFLHIAGALKHAIIDKDQTLSRMVPGSYQDDGTPPLQQSRQPLAAIVALCVGGLGIVAAFALHTWEAKPVASKTLELAATKNTKAWVIDQAKSRLEIEVAQLGSPVNGEFAAWNAVVVFDLENLAGSSIQAEISIASLSLGDVSSRAISDEFLNAPANPTAKFRSSSVTKTQNGFQAEGTIELAGVEKPLSLPFTFREENGRAFVTASTEIARLDFGVGQAFADDSSVGRVVKVNITIEAERP